MGLAASQARFLGITARKSNIEYEGQQVNQQRTALAEEVNSLYSQLLSLKVPIAPEATQYYETNYSFSIADTTQEKNGDYLIKSYFENDNGTYYINAVRTYNKNVAQQSDLSKQWKIEGDAASGYTLVNIKDDSKKYTLNQLSEGDSKNMIDLINATAGVTPIPDSCTSLFSYKDTDGQTHYIPDFQVNSYTEGAELFSYLKTNKDIQESVVFDDVTLGFDTNNRVKSISIPDLVTGLDVDTKRVYNEEGYEAALRDYTMSKDEYNKAVADLNAKTESLQQEDKVLELRLNQIDTEQNELQTELEAVKAVLDKNIENTFNTFS